MDNYLRFRQLNKNQRREFAAHLANSTEGTDGMPPCSPHYAHNALRSDELGFSVFFFADRGGRDDEGLYDLLMQSAALADRLGLHAIWVPERHFHEFGAGYPNPSVLASAIAASTTRIGIRAGSVVLPLHNPIRVIEEWSVVDNISNGRVGISIASGWHPADFELLASASYEHRHVETDRRVADLLRGWTTGRVKAFGASQSHLYPRPLQPILPLWLTSTRNPRTWRAAGRLGCGVLTGLMEQNLDDLAANIDVYHQALASSGHARESAYVTVMLHTYIGESTSDAISRSRPALDIYLRNHMRMYEAYLRTQDADLNLDALSEADRAALVDQGISRYMNGASLIGSVEQALDFSVKLRALGVHEIACLVDFGIPTGDVLRSIGRISDVAQRANCAQPPIGALS